MSEAVERKVPDWDQPFSRMADKVVANLSNGFAGAAVIVLPNGETIEVLLLDSEASPALILSSVKTKIEIKVAEILEKERGTQTGFGRR